MARWALLTVVPWAVVGCGGGDDGERAVSAGPRLTPAVARDLDGQILPELVRAALGDYQR